MDVQVRNGCKSYEDGVPVLDKLNLNVKSGTIFGLLGASGCGKTTLLSCIAGLRRLDSGEITVLGCAPGGKGSIVPGVGVGYMPQTMSLSLPVTIKETFKFYGKFNGMSNKAIDERTEFLSKFLELPELSKLIIKLSGGQLRRVSLGVALIHEPPLLLLDEPTVGLDPLLRESIWDHLIDLVKENKTTILISTHYSEEAKSCDTIGIMRKGRLIAEQSPAQLLALYNSQCLETTVLNLCRTDEINIGNPDGVRIESELARSNEQNELVQFSVHENCKIYQTRQLSSCIKRDIDVTMAMVYRLIVFFWRQPAVVIAQLVIPLVNIILCNHIIGTDPVGLQLSFVSEEWNIFQRSDIIDFCTSYKENGTCLEGGISLICTFFNQFDKYEISWVPKSTEEDALISVHRGDTIGYVNFPTNFSEHFNNRLLLMKHSDNETIDGSTLSIRMDMSNALSSLWLIERFVVRYSGYLRDVVKNCGMNVQRAQIPLKYHSVYKGVEADWSWAQFMKPFLIMAMTYLTTGATGALLSLYKRWGIMDRWTVSGVKFKHIVFSSIICDSCIMFAQIGILFSVLPYFYGMNIRGSWFLAMLIVYLASLGGLVLGILLGTVCNHEMEYIMMYMFFNSVSLLSSGGLWPLEGIPRWYRWICQMIPISMPIQALRSIIFRGWGLANVEVWWGLVISVFYIVLCITIGVLFQNKRK